MDFRIRAGLECSFPFIPLRILSRSFRFLEFRLRNRSRRDIHGKQVFLPSVPLWDDDRQRGPDVAIDGGVRTQMNFVMLEFRPSRAGSCVYQPYKAVSGGAFTRYFSDQHSHLPVSFIVVKSDEHPIEGRANGKQIRCLHSC